MNKIIAFFVMSLSFGALVLGTAACGDDPCDELAARCGNCTDSAAEFSCELTEALDDSDSCQAALDDDQVGGVCPL
jgi:hypothetical protein